MIRFSEDAGSFEVKKDQGSRESSRRRREGRDADFCVLELDDETEGKRSFEIADWRTTTLTRNEASLEITQFRRLGEHALPDENVSRKHAEIVRKAGKFYVRDLGSLNGTLLNGRRLSEEKRQSQLVPLRSGDVLACGKINFRVSVRRRFVSRDEELEDQVNPLEKQMRVSVPRISVGQAAGVELSTPERLLMEELERHETGGDERVRRGEIALKSADAGGTTVDSEWQEIRLTAEENLDKLDNPRSKRLRLRSKGSVPDDSAQNRSTAHDSRNPDLDRQFKFHREDKDVEGQQETDEPAIQIISVSRPQ
mmetsp:Transcript_5422/g.7547  ORF Transcript_5422/g.7547 Transcript_5422/m.7547 type:complete len:310 (-) Transcript_5422:1086-2015(-)